MIRRDEEGLMPTTIKKIALLLPTLVVVILATVVILSYRGYLGYKFFTVMTGSMAPAVALGSLIVVKPADSYSVNDILTFKSSETDTITHRLIAVIGTSWPPPFDHLYQLKGDANQTPDSSKITKSQIVGKVIFSFPLIGFLIIFTKTPIGFISLIVLPAVIISVSEIKKIREAL